MKERDYEIMEGRSGYSSLSFPTLMRKVYLWMSLALVITAVTAYGVGSTPNLLTMVWSTKYVPIILIVVQLGLVLGLSTAIQKMSLMSATAIFTLYSIVTGITLSSLLVIYSPTILTKVFLITAGMFGSMAFIGYTTKSDLTSIGKFAFMALIGLIIASVVNMFLHSPSFDYILSYIGVAIFIGLTAYDSQKIKEMLATCPDGGEEAQKLALLGSLTLYLDFINLFLYLLRIFGRSRD